jgi:hypothetical protein
MSASPLAARQRVDAALRQMIDPGQLHGLRRNLRLPVPG